MRRAFLGAGLATVVAIGAGAIALAQSGASAPPAFLPGYLQHADIPNSLAIVPPAPEPGSATQGRDEAERKAAEAFRTGPRWDLATRDADLHFPAAAGAYACALNAPISAEATPRLYVLLRKVLADAGASTYPSKNRYHRPRPFMVRGGEVCTPADAEHLRNDGSYPSGHAAVGWAWALVLAEVSPDHQDQILARGRAFMQSRVICNVHWRSDIEAGGEMGAAVVARLHADPAFRADVEAARSEIAAARAAGLAPTRDCKAEAAALALAPITQP
jgi:acid phosphatase (class A)